MKRIASFLIAICLGFVAMAQNSGGADVSIDINKSGGSTGGFPWLWVVGAIVFIVLLVALLSGGRGGTDRVIEKKTIIKE